MAVYAAGKMVTKAQVIENFKTGATKYDSIEEHESKIRLYGNTAVVNTLFSVKATTNGKPYSGDVRNIRVWVNQHDNWKLVAFQNTTVAPPSP